MLSSGKQLAEEQKHSQVQRRWREAASSLNACCCLCYYCDIGSCRGDSLDILCEHRCGEDCIMVGQRSSAAHFLTSVFSS